jgi:hypothetical protein
VKAKRLFERRSGALSPAARGSGFFINRLLTAGLMFMMALHFLKIAASGWRWSASDDSSPAILGGKHDKKAYDSDLLKR